MVKSLYALGADEKLADKEGCDAMMRAASIGTNPSRPNPSYILTFFLTPFLLSPILDTILAYL